MMAAMMAAAHYRGRRWTRLYTSSEVAVKGELERLDGIWGEANGNSWLKAIPVLESWPEEPRPEKGV